MISLNFSEAASHFHDVRHRLLDKKQLEEHSGCFRICFHSQSVAGHLPAESMLCAVVWRASLSLGHSQRTISCLSRDFDCQITTGIRFNTLSFRFFSTDQLMNGLTEWLTMCACLCVHVCGICVACACMCVHRSQRTASNATPEASSNFVYGRVSILIRVL